MPEISSVELRLPGDVIYFHVATQRHTMEHNKVGYKVGK